MDEVKGINLFLFNHVDSLVVVAHANNLAVVALAKNFDFNAHHIHNLMQGSIFNTFSHPYFVLDTFRFGDHHTVNLMVLHNFKANL